VELTLTDARGRLEARADGELLGWLELERSPGRLVLVHTEVRPAAEGRGVGSALLRAALERARDDGDRVVPRCPFARTWIERHPGYADLVA
jgi:predicted GNAT family acetyltransferase